MPTPIIELRGRLGNQLFQFAFGRAIAKGNGGAVAFLPTFQWNKGNRLPEVIATGYREPTYGELLRVLRIGGEQRRGDDPPRVLLDAALRRGGLAMSRRLKWPHYVTESAGGFDPALLSVNGPSLLAGYFQSESYFLEVSAEINTAIRLPSVDNVIDDLPRPIVSVSFRRGDYSDYSGLLPLSYYDAALHMVRDLIEPATLLILADDPDFAELASDRLSPYGLPVIGSRRDNSDLHDMALMASADHNVISNSSFAWWGAWLAEHRVNMSNHVVVAPRPWFRNRKDVVPGRWLSVDW